MVDSSPSEASSNEYVGYDPVSSKMLDVTNYQPQFAPSESKDDLSSVDLSDSEFTPVYNSKYLKSSPSSHELSEDDVEVEHNQKAQYRSNVDSETDRRSVTVVENTPTYAPSRVEESDSVDSVPSSNESGVVTQKQMKPEYTGFVNRNEIDEEQLSKYSDESDLDEEQGDRIKIQESFTEQHGEFLEDIEGDDEDPNRYADEFEGFERDEQPQSQVDGIIADIFGESDAEEEFEGFAENELDKGIEEDDAEQQKAPEEPVDKEKMVSQPGDGEDEESGDGEEFVSDFDLIMERKREEMRRKRRRNKDIEFLNDSDDLIVETISRMRSAADEDRQLLSSGQPATKKLAIFKEVVTLLKRADLKSALIDNGMLSAITEWLSPLPGHTLPNLIIRDSMLTCLNEFQTLSPEVLQESGVGKALMYLYRHPRETKDNKDKAERLINQWLRPIFNLTSDYRTLTKEERKQLDYEHLPKRRNIGNDSYNHRDINRELDGEQKGIVRPGDPGWIGRARVPQPSNKDYIIRPKWNLTSETGDGDDDYGAQNDDEDDDVRQSSNARNLFRKRRSKPNASGLGTSSRIESHIRNLASSARRSLAKTARAVPMSIEGRKMTL